MGLITGYKYPSTTRMRTEKNNMKQWLRYISLGMAIVFFYVHIAYGAIEPVSKFWQERRKATEKLYNDKRRGAEENVAAKVPLPENGNTLLAQLSSIDVNVLSNSFPTVSNLGQNTFSSFLSLQAQEQIKENFPSVPKSNSLPKWVKSVPMNHVNLKELYLPPSWKPSDPMVIHIQDVHENYEAQRNIARMIEALVKSQVEGSKLDGSAAISPAKAQSPVVVGIEGARGAFDFTLYRSFPDKEITKAIADYFLKESFITGPEYVGFTTEQLPLFWGVEDEKPYLEHVQAFKDTTGSEKNAKAICLKLNGEASLLKEKIFHSELKDLDTKIAQNVKGQLKLGEYIKFLAKDGSLVSDKNAIGKFLATLKLEESLNYSQVEKERKELTEKLVSKLPKAELKNLVSASLSYQLGELTYGAFYQYLRDMSQAYGVSIRDWPEMDKYIRYVFQCDKVQAEDLFAEIEALKNKRLQALIQTPQEKELVRISQDILLLEKLVAFGLSPVEWQEYSSRIQEIQNIQNRIERLSGNVQSVPQPNLSRFLRPFEKFSEAAIARNTIIVKNFLAKIQSQSASQESRIAVLVAGGFHTTGITEILRHEQVAYAVFTPQLGKVEGDGTEYLNVFRREKTPLEKLFSCEKITLKSQGIGAAQPIGGQALPNMVLIPKLAVTLEIGEETLKTALDVTNFDDKFEETLRGNIAKIFELVRTQSPDSQAFWKQVIDHAELKKVREVRNEKGQVEQLTIELELAGDQIDHRDVEMTLVVQREDSEGSIQVKNGYIMPLNTSLSHKGYRYSIVHSQPEDIFGQVASISATAFNGRLSWLKNLSARIVFLFAIPVQETLHLALAKLFKMPTQVNIGSLWSAVNIDYSRAPPWQANIVRLGGLFGNLAVGLLTWAMFGHPTFDFNNFWALHTFTSLIIVMNLTLFISDILLSVILKRGDLWDALHPQMNISVGSKEIPFKPNDYLHMDISKRDEDHSLNVAQMLETKFPREILSEIREKKHKIELHRGSLTVTAAYLENLKKQGYSVTELPDVRSPQKFYFVQQGETLRYVIANIGGGARELFLLQALYKYYGYPEDLILIRIFNDGGIQKVLARHLRKYSGNIQKAILLFEVDKYIEVISEDPLLHVEVIDRIKADYVDAAVIRVNGGQPVLLFNIQNTGSWAIAETGEFFIKSSAEDGLGIRDITLHDVCGGIGEGNHINDLILYSDIYLEGRKLNRVPTNNVNIDELELPEGVKIHQIPIWTVPTMLNEPITLTQRIKQLGGGGLELELGYLARFLANHPEVTFRAFYEIHDNPTTNPRKKESSLGTIVPGYRDPLKRHTTWRALARYLFIGNGTGRAASKIENSSPINEASEVLSNQTANVVFEFNKKLAQWVFRRGSLRLPIPQSLAKSLGNSMPSQESSILLALRNDSKDLIDRALLAVINEGVSPLEAFQRNGIKATSDYKKILLIAPYGNQQGGQLKYFTPHKGVEYISFLLLRQLEDVDARVYNPNLTSMEDLYEFVQNEKFDVIAFSFLQSVIERNLEILSRVHQMQPQALIMMGGHELPIITKSFNFGDLPLGLPLVSQNPFLNFVQAVPVSLYIIDPLSIIDVMRHIHAHKSREHNLDHLSSIPGLMTVYDSKIYITKSANRLQPVYQNVDEDIPYREDDLTHFNYYREQMESKNVPIMFDRIGKNPLRVVMSDFCEADCIFCGVNLFLRRFPPVPEVMRFIEENFDDHDSIHFEHVDFLFKPSYAIELAQALKESKFKDVPKIVVCRVTRVTDEITSLFKEAGIEIMAYGIESFNPKVLDEIGKRSTPEDNIRALESTLKSGIRPGINMILFTPWDSVDKLKRTVDITISYALRGAYVNIVPMIYAGYGRPIANMENILSYKELYFPGMKKKLFFPYSGRILDQELDQLMAKTFEVKEEISEEADVAEEHFSVAIDSLLWLKAFYIAYGEVRHATSIGSDLSNVDRAINFVLQEQEKTKNHVAESDGTPSITATMYRGNLAWLKNLPARAVFFLAIPVQELLHWALAKFFKMPTQLGIGSLWSMVNIDYSRAPPWQATIVRLGGLFGNLAVGLLTWAMFGHPTFDFNNLWPLHTFTSLFIVMNLTLFISDILLSVILKRGDLWEVLHPSDQFDADVRSLRHLSYQELTQALARIQNHLGQQIQSQSPGNLANIEAVISLFDTLGKLHILGNEPQVRRTFGEAFPRSQIEIFPQIERNILTRQLEGNKITVTVDDLEFARQFKYLMDAFSLGDNVERHIADRLEEAFARGYSWMWAMLHENDRFGRTFQVSDLGSETKVFDVSNPKAVQGAIMRMLNQVDPEALGKNSGIVFVAKSQGELDNMVKGLRYGLKSNTEGLQKLNELIVGQQLRLLVDPNLDGKIHVDFVYHQLEDWKWASLGVQIMTDSMDRWLESFTARVQILLIMGMQMREYRSLEDINNKFREILTINIQA